jgi:protein-ribulosamine 3-kinase
MAATYPWPAIAESIERATGVPFVVERSDPVGGGCINQGFELRGGGREFFVKLNTAASLSMFEAEAAGLEEITATGTVRVPRAVCAAADALHAWLALEHLPLSANGGPAMASLGEQLAAMHRATRERFGWRRDNTIGSTPQVNTQLLDWVEFWRRHRLGYQLALAARNGYRSALQNKGAQLLEQLPQFFQGYRPAASLLHGDLWGGNMAATAGGEPVIFDPAVYYGDREADLAMTMLFGGFTPAFYRAYETQWPLDPGHRERRELYNLYHVLNHLNLFGGGYRAQAEGMIDRLLAALRG